MTLSNPKDVLTEERLSDFYQQILPYLGGTAEAGFTPVGTVIAVMGNSAPANYLACNGQVVNIADYPVLADYFEAQFGTKNHFGGDGTTTFAVPDLRGEFLRGTGTNSHENQGNGANVGVHQDATELNNPEVSSSEKKIQFWGLNDWNSLIFKNADSNINKSNRINFTGASTEISTTQSKSNGCVTIRPTNTSVLYCIATHNIFINPELQYSTQEQVVGTWIDGKPLHQKTVSTGGSEPSGATLIQRIAMASTGYDTIKYTKTS